jgi:hypothetical protein
MASKFKIFWYRKSVFVKNAFLYNCRDNDLQRSLNGWIKEGQIVSGATGYVIAEHNVPGFAFGLTGKIVPFESNWDCNWQGLILPCMAHEAIPSHKSYLRPYNYVVAQLPDEEAVKIVVKNKVPVIITLDQKLYVNLEIFWSFQKQDKNRRAKLIY